MRILYEDNHILVAEKPANMPCQADSSKDADMLNLLKAYIKQSANKPGAVYLGLCHRLDRPVGGVMVFAKTSKAAKRLCSLFAENKAERRYVAVVVGRPPEESVLIDYLKLSDKRMIAYNSPLEGAKRAELSLRTLMYSGDYALVDIALKTGRKHQIRSQLMNHGWPVRFDMRYNPSPEKGQIALFAYCLGFMHPTKKEYMRFVIAPNSKSFFGFEPCLKLLIENAKNMPKGCLS